MLYVIDFMMLLGVVSSKTYGEEIADTINDYRATRGQSRIPYSRALMLVGAVHVKNTCDATKAAIAVCESPHEWYDIPGQTEDFGTTCPLPDTCGGDGWVPCSWNKPREIAGVDMTGYEISSFGTTTSPDVALSRWQSSTPHHNVIIAEGSFVGFEWKSIGCGANVMGKDRIYHCWFATESDPTPYSPVEDVDCWNRDPVYVTVEGQDADFEGCYTIDGDLTDDLSFTYLGPNGYWLYTVTYGSSTYWMMNKEKDKLDWAGGWCSGCGNGQLQPTRCTTGQWVDGSDFRSQPCTNRLKHNGNIIQFGECPEVEAWYVNEMTSLEGCYVENGNNDGVAAYSGPNGYWLYRRDERRRKYWLISQEKGKYIVSNGKCKTTALEDCNDDSRGWDKDVETVKKSSCSGWYVNVITSIEGCYVDNGKKNDGVTAYYGPDGNWLYRRDERRRKYWLISKELNKYDVSNGRCKTTDLKDCNDDDRGWDKPLETTKGCSANREQAMGFDETVKRNNKNVTVIVFIIVSVVFVMMFVAVLWFCWMKRRKRKHETMKAVVAEESDDEEEDEEVEVEVELTQETV